jgi:hypothetical protein
VAVGVGGAAGEGPAGGQDQAKLHARRSSWIGKYVLGGMPPGTRPLSTLLPQCCERPSRFVQLRKDLTRRNSPPEEIRVTVSNCSCPLKTTRSNRILKRIYSPYGSTMVRRCEARVRSLVYLWHRK